MKCEIPKLRRSLLGWKISTSSLCWLIVMSVWAVFCIAALYKGRVGYLFDDIENSGLTSEELEELSYTVTSIIFQNQAISIVNLLSTLLAIYGVRLEEPELLLPVVCLLIGAMLSILVYGTCVLVTNIYSPLIIVVVAGMVLLLLFVFYVFLVMYTQYRDMKLYQPGPGGLEAGSNQEPEVEFNYSYTPATNELRSGNQSTDRPNYYCWIPPSPVYYWHW